VKHNLHSGGLSDNKQTLKVFTLFLMSLRARDEAVSILELKIASDCTLAMMYQEGEQLPYW
jgi:hypothetical protein